MRIALHLFGHEIVALTTGEAEEYEEPGDCTTTPIGFAPSPGDQRWAECDTPGFTGWED